MTSIFWFCQVRQRSLEIAIDKVSPSSNETGVLGAIRTHDFARQRLAGDRRIMRQLETRFGLEAPPKELVAATRQVIVDSGSYQVEMSDEGLMTDSIPLSLATNP